MEVRKVLLYVVCIIGIHLTAQSDKNNGLVQFTGVVLTNIGDSSYKVPFVTVKNLSRYSSSYSNINGIFSLVVKRGDTVQFSSIGYKTNTLVIPMNIKEDRFFANHSIKIKAKQLNEVVILPWKNIDELKRAFVNLELKDDDVILAYQNMQYYRMARMQETMKLSPSEAYRYTLSNQNLYNNNMAAMNNNQILNPMAWFQFIDQYIFKNKKKSSKNIQNKYEPLYGE